MRYKVNIKALQAVVKEFGQRRSKEGVWREIRPGVLKSGGHGRNVAKSSGRKWILRYEYLGVTRAGSCSRRALWQVASAAVAHFYQEWLRKVQAGPYTFSQGQYPQFNL